MRRLSSPLPRPWAGVLLAAVVGASLLAPSAGAAPGVGHQRAHKKVCTDAPAGSANCHAQVVVDSSGAPFAAAAPTSGYFPADLQAAYGVLGATAGAGKTVAIVDAYDHPYAEADLAVYRAQFGLPPCTTQNGCFRKVDQNGRTNRYPKANASWAQEISLDLDMVSAICPNCKILLVEATSNSFANLAAAVNRAAILGAVAISNSYGALEFSTETSYESPYNHPGVAITVSSGDSGYGVQFPAASRYVTAVGGTSLVRNGTGFTETAWSGAGSGCSAYIAKPAFQTDAGCAKRSVADVSAVADPNTGVAVYDSYAYQGAKGWMVFGGTSVAAPIVAAVYALGGSHAPSSYETWLYAHAGSLTDVVSGVNGTCAVPYLCQAGQGYDGPTGLGTPKGLGAF